MPGAGWVSCSCPLAPWEHQSGKDVHPSFAIKCSDTEESSYNCFTCGGGDLITLIHKLARHGASLPQYNLKTALEVAIADGERPLSFHVKEWGVPEAAPYVTFPELWLATFMHAMQSPRAHTYLNHRGLPDRVIEQLDLRYDTEKDTICFPIRDFDSTLCGLRGRRIAPTGDQPRYHVYKSALRSHNSSVWYGESWINFDKPVVMCESVFDAASICRVYANVCAPMSAGFSEDRARRMRQAVEIVTLFDADKAGDKARSRVSMYLSSAFITHLFPPEGRKDPGEMTESELRELLCGVLPLDKGVNDE